MKVKSVFVFVVVAFAIFVSTINTVSAQSSLGISPPYIINESLLPGSEFEQEFILSRSTPDVDAVAKLESELGIIDSWIEFDKGDEFIMPAGEQRVSLIGKVKVPEDAELGSYKGAVRVNLRTDEEGGQVKLLPAVRIDINLEVVSDTVRNFKINLAEIPDFASGRDLGLVLKIDNAGNAADGPSKVELAITDLSDNPITDLTTEDIPKAKSFTVEDVEAKISNELEQGEYYASIKVYDGSEIIYTDQVVFEVLENDGGSDSDGLFGGDISNSLIAGGAAILAVPVLGILYLFFVKKKGDKKDRK